jgi:ATP-dependent Clp protease ATP-binding subunit ClpA
MTSNAGSREMSTHTIGFGDARSDSANKGMKAVEKCFSPEFRNRLDAIISFQSLSIEIMEKIVDKFIAEINVQLSPRKIRIELSPDAGLWLAKKGYDPQYGARPLSRLIQNEIKDVLADRILFGNLEKGGTVQIGLEGDKLTFDTHGLKHAGISPVG